MTTDIVDYFALVVILIWIATFTGGALLSAGYAVEAARRGSWSEFGLCMVGAVLFAGIALSALGVIS